MFQSYRKNNPIVGDDGKWIMDPTKVAEPTLANKKMVELILFGTAETIGIICEYRDLLKQVNACKDAFSYDIEEEPLVPPPSEQFDEEEEDEDNSEFHFQPKHVAMMLEKLNQIAKLSMISLPTFIFMVEDLIALSKAAPENQAYLPKRWLGLSNSQIAKLGTSVMVQREFINWKNFLISCMDFPMPSQEDILDMLFQFRTLDPDLINCLDKNKFDLCTLWFEPTDPATIAQDTSFLLWRECIYQLFCDRYNLFQYIEFLLYFSKSPDSRIGLANSLALLTGNFIPIDKLPSEGEYGPTELPVTDSELELLFTEEDLLMEHDEPVDSYDLYHPKGQKLNLTRRMTLLRDRRNQVDGLEYTGEYLEGNTQIQGYKAPPSTRSGSRMSEAELTDESETQTKKNTDTEQTNEENDGKAEAEDRKHKRSSTAPRHSSVKKSKHKKKKEKNTDADKSESTETVNARKSEKRLSKRKKSKDAMRKKGKKGEKSKSWQDVEEYEEEEGTEEEMEEEPWEEEEEQEEEIQYVPASGLRLIPLESFLQALWFGHITAYPIKNQSFLSVGFNKLKDLVQSVYQEIHARDASELADPNAVELTALLKHPFVRELLKRYKGFEKMDITAKLKEILNMPPEESEEEPKPESDTGSLPSTTPSVEFPPLPPSPTSTSTFNESFSRIFSCLSLQTKSSDASAQSGLFEATRTKPFTLAFNKKKEMVGEEDDDIFLHYKGGVSPTCSYADVVQMEVPVIDIMRASGLPSPQSFAHLDNGSEEEEEESGLDKLQQGSYEMEGEVEEIGEDGDYLRRAIKGDEGTGSSMDSLGSKFRPIRERESEIIRRKEFSPFNFGMDPKLSSLLWKM